MSADIRRRYSEAIGRANEVINWYPSYFEDVTAVTSIATEQQVIDNHYSSAKANDITYISLPDLYPEQAARVWEEQGVSPIAARIADRPVVMPSRGVLTRIK